MERQVSNYPSAIPAEISISENKSEKYFDRNMKPFKNGTVFDNRYVPTVKSSAGIVCYSCNQVGHKSNKCIFDKTLGHVKCRKCQTLAITNPNVMQEMALELTF